MDARDGTPNYYASGSGAVNVETDDEVRAHPQQVLKNMITPFLWNIERVKIVCSKKSESGVIDLRQQLPPELSNYVDVVGISVAAAEGRE